MTPNVFPFTMYAEDHGNYVSSPRLALSIWNRVRADLKKKFAWYAVDAEITAPDVVRLYVHEMQNSFYGGIGRMIFDITITEFEPAEENILKEEVLKVYTMAAERELSMREEHLRQQQILAVRQEMFGM